MFKKFPSDKKIVEWAKRIVSSNHYGVERYNVFDNGEFRVMVEFSGVSIWYNGQLVYNSDQENYTYYKGNISGLGEWINEYKDLSEEVL